MKETGFTDCIERPAGIAGLTRIAGIDVFYINSVSDCFVFNEYLKLIECPSAQNTIESSASTFCTDSFQVLHHNRSCFAVVFDNPFTDDVVCVPHEPCLLTFEAFQVPLSRASAFTLETTAKFSYFMQSGFHATKELSVGCCCEFAYSDINPDNMCAILSKLDVSGNKHMNIELIAFFNDIRTACCPLVIFSEIFWNVDRYFEPAVNCGYADNAFFEINPEITDVISNWNTADIFGLTVLSDNSNRLTSQLRWQNSFRADYGITLYMDALETADMTMLESNFNGFVELNKCFRNRIIGWKFELDNCFGTHKNNIVHKSINNYVYQKPQFIPRLKSWASLRTET